MPNAVKSLHTLMKLSFKLEPPTTRELKASVYKKYLQNDDEFGKFG